MDPQKLVEAGWKLTKWITFPMLIAAGIIYLVLRKKGERQNEQTKKVMGKLRKRNKRRN